MDLSDLSVNEHSALIRILEYWVAHWDWECPTLFGLEKDDFEAVLKEWPQSVVKQRSIAALALIGAMREFLYGASGVREEQVLRLAGLSYAETSALLEKLKPRIEHALEKY